MKSLFCCHRGEALVWHDGSRVIVIFRVHVVRDPHSLHFLATCEDIPRLGRGQTADDAMAQFSHVLMAYLRYQQRCDQLVRLFTQLPWQRVFLTDSAKQRMLSGISGPNTLRIDISAS